MYQTLLLDTLACLKFCIQFSDLEAKVIGLDVFSF